VVNGEWMSGRCKRQAPVEIRIEVSSCSSHP